MDFDFGCVFDGFFKGVCYGCWRWGCCWVGMGLCCCKKCFLSLMCWWCVMVCDRDLEWVFSDSGDGLGDDGKMG